MIVIDASSLTKFLLKEEHWEKVEEYLGKEIASIDFVLLEAANAIWKEHILRKKIDKEQASKIFENLQKIKEGVITIEQSAGYLKTGYDIATAQKTTIYDAVYITQAQKYGSLLTSDKVQSEIAEKLDVKTIFIQ